MDASERKIVFRLSFSDLSHYTVCGYNLVIIKLQLMVKL